MEENSNLFANSVISQSFMKTILNADFTMFLFCDICDNLVFFQFSYFFKLLKGIYIVYEKILGSSAQIMQ